MGEENQQQSSVEIGERRAARDLPRIISEVVDYFAAADLSQKAAEASSATQLSADIPSIEPQIVYKDGAVQATLQRIYSTATDAPWLLVQKLDEQGQPVGEIRTFGFSPNMTDEVYELNALTGELTTHFDTEIDPATGQDYGAITDLYVTTARTVVAPTSEQ